MMVRKKDSRLVRLIGLLLRPFNPKFMEEYTTVIGSTIYLPNRWDSFSKKKQIIILAHENVHIEQYREHGLWFLLSYALLPLPMFYATYRCRWEAEAYQINILGGMPMESAIEELYGPRYLYAGRLLGRTRIRKMLEEHLG